MNETDKNVVNKIDDNLSEAIEYYLSTKEKLGVKSKELSDYLLEDPSLSKKITFEEAVLMNPSILDSVENDKQILISKSNSEVENKSKSEQVMDDFMKKLEDGHFDISEPQIGKEFNPTPEFIEKTISNYQKLLESGLIPSNEEKGPSLVKKNID